MEQKIITKEISGIASAIYDMRKPMESKSDSAITMDSDGLNLIELGEKDEVLMKKLARTPSGSGHDCFLKSITVHADFTMTHDFILQFYRYSFRDTVSSESKMHSIHKGDIADKCSDYVSVNTIDFVNDLIKLFNDVKNDEDVVKLFNNNDAFYYAVNKTPSNKKELFECIIHNTPLGYMLTFGEVINYLQLKTMWKQRKNHKMSSWNTVFVNWVRSLPYSYLITGEYED